MLFRSPYYLSIPSERQRRRVKLSITLDGSVLSVTARGVIRITRRAELESVDLNHEDSGVIGRGTVAKTTVYPNDFAILKVCFSSDLLKAR